MNGPNARMSFDDILDICLDRITGGRATIDDCLETYPQHRAELEPVLRAAIELTALPRVPERPVDPARRARFMAELRSTPQQDARRVRLPSLGSALGSLFPRGLLGRATMTLAPAAAVAALAIVLVLGSGATPATASTLTVFAGGVERQVDGVWAPIEDGSELLEGDRVRTTADGHALITFADGSTASLDPDTELAILEVRLDGARSITLEQFSGRLWNDVADDDRAGAGYVVRTPDAVIVVQGTIFESAITNGETSVSTAEGLVSVTAGTRRIDVQPGEIVRAGRASVSVTRLEDHRAIELTIEGPFTVALIAPDGAATGARPDGAVFNQIRGVFTSNPGHGPQVLAIQRPEPGEYTLVLQRIGPGDGRIVFSGSGAPAAVPLGGIGDAVRLKVRLGDDGGRPAIAVLHERPEPVDRETPEVRVVDSPRIRERAASVAEQRERLAAATGSSVLTTLVERNRAVYARVIEALASDDPRTLAARVTRVVGELELHRDLRERLLTAIDNGHAGDIRVGLLGAIAAREPEVTRALLRRVASNIEGGLTVSSALLTETLVTPSPAPALTPTLTEPRLRENSTTAVETPRLALRQLLTIEDAREFRVALLSTLGRFDLPEGLALHVLKSLTFENVRELRLRIAEVVQARDATAAELARLLRTTLEAFLEHAESGALDGARLSDSDGTTTLEAEPAPEPTPTSDSTTLSDSDGTTTTTEPTTEPEPEPTPTSDATTSDGTDDGTKTDTSTTTEPEPEATLAPEDDSTAIDSPTLSLTN